MASAVEWPTEVLAAATVKFEAPVDAFLWKPVIDSPCLVGRVFMISLAGSKMAVQFERLKS